MGNWLSWILGRDNGNDEKPPDYSTVIIDLRSFLLDLIDTGYGLLDELLERGVLTNQEVEVIQFKSGATSQVEQLLNYVIKMAPDKQDTFMTCLDNTQHRHVVNYIRANGDRSKVPLEEADAWPMLRGDEQIKKWDFNKSKMIELIDARNGLLDEMLSAGCINDRLMQEIESKPTSAQANEHIFRALRRKSVADYKAFVDCLRRTNQCQVVHLLEPDSTAETDRPLNEAQLKRLTANYAAVVSTIETQQGLMDHLLAEGCITENQAQFIESAGALRRDRNKRLLDIVKHGSERNYAMFLECLKRTNQGYVSDMLSDDGVVAILTAKFDVGHISPAEEQLIVERFMALLQRCPDTELENLYALVTHEVIDRRQRGIRMVAASTGHSIELYFICKSLTGLQHHYDLQGSGELGRFLENMFTCLIDVGRPIKFASLQWRRSNCMKCFQFMSSVNGLPIFYEIYQLAENGEDDVPATDDCDALVNCSPSEFYAERLPFELMESIMIRTATCLYNVLNRKTPSAEVYTMATLCAVSNLWRRVLTDRMFNRRSMLRCFRRVCSPFARIPRKLEVLQTAGVGSVWSVAELDGKLYVASDETNLIQVFAGSQPFERLEDFKVPGLNSSRDIVARKNTMQLYVADWATQCAIWRMTLPSHDIVKFADMDWRPWAMSFNFDRMLVTPFDGDTLYQYGDDGTELNRIQLPNYMFARHAVQMDSDTFIVSHGNRPTADFLPEHCNVSEVNVKGDVIRRFNGQYRNVELVKFKWPQFLAIGDNRHLTVADRIGKRVALLTSDLQLKRVLMTSLEGQPIRMCYSEENGLLFVTYLYSSKIDVFRVRRTR